MKQRDHGNTFKIGASVKFDGSNETMAVQILNTGLYVNSRNLQGNVKERIVSYSNDGGVTWDTTYYDKNLPDPVNQDSVLSWRIKGRYMLAVCNAATANRKDNLTLRLSKDQGKTWFFNQVVSKVLEGVKVIMLSNLILRFWIKIESVFYSGRIIIVKLCLCR